MYYIYKFLNKEQEDIYIGITNDIKRRINQQHFTSVGHLDEECYKETEYVVYSKCTSKDDAKIKERYLINKINPKYNYTYSNNNEFKFIIDDFQWTYIPFNKEKFFKSIKESKKRKEDSENICIDISSIEIPDNVVNVFASAKLNKQDINLIKTNGLDYKLVFRFKGTFDYYKIHALKINGELYFVFHNIEDIHRVNAPTTSNILSNMLSYKAITSTGILAVEDKIFIERVIRSHTLNERHEYLYPKKIYLISNNEFISAYGGIKFYKQNYPKELYVLMEQWVQLNFKVK